MRFKLDEKVCEAVNNSEDILWILNEYKQMELAAEMSSCL